MHPVEAIRGERSDLLRGRKIVLGITGSIAAVQCFDLARDLIRHGAEVETVMSRDAARIITPSAMEFATGKPPITEVGGGVEHVDLCGEYEGKTDLLLIAPCTANTISKVALGIDDTPVTTMATTAIGTGIPVILAPAMHGSMFNHPIVRRNMETLGEIGVEIVGPRIIMGKAKITTNEELVSRSIRRLGRRDFQGTKVLVIGGSSEEPIDGMRVITNRGTGETAVELAVAAYERGADVDLWMGRHKTSIPDFMEVREFRRLSDLEAMIGGVNHDLVMVPAALSDYAPEEAEGKIPTWEGELVLRLRPLPKILSKLGGDHALVGFKAEHGISEEELVDRATRKLEANGLDMIVANDLTDVGNGITRVLVIPRNGKKVRSSGTKREVADSILDEVQKVLP